MSADREFARFQVETRHLRDSAIDALSGSHIGRFDDALGVYRGLLKIALETDRAMHTTHDQHFGGNSFVADREYGREWRSLIRDLHAIVDVLAESASPRSWGDFCDFLGAVSVDTASLPEGSAIRDYWLLATEAWGSLVRETSPDAAMLRDNILFTLHNLIWLRRPTALDPDQAKEVVRRLAVSYPLLMKRAVDSDAEAALLECLEYFDNSFDRRFADWGSARGEKPLVDEQVFVTSCLLVIYAWVLFRVGERERADMSKARERIRESLRGRPVWEAMKSLRKDEFENYLRASWWEVEMKGGRGGGVMVMSTYEALAGALGGARPPSSSRASADDFQEANVLLRLLSEDGDGPVARLNARTRAASDNLALLRERLTALAEASEDAEAEQLALAEVAGDRIELFREAILSRLPPARRGSFVSFLRKIPAPAADESVLGWQGRVPKHYFADTQVHADPDELGRSFVEMLVRGEEDRVLSWLSDGIESDVARTEVALESLKEIAADKDPSRWAVVTNSWSAAETLVPEWWQNEEEDFQEAPDSGIRVYQVWRDSASFIAFVDRESSVEVIRGALDADEPTDEVYPALGLLIGVSELSEEQLAELELKEPPISRLEARGTVLVRVLEAFSVKGVSSPKVLWYALPQE